MIATTNRHASQLEIVPATKSRARVSSIGARSFLLEAPGDFDLVAQRRIWALSQSVKGWPDLAENIPGMTNLLVIFKETPEDPDAVVARLLEAWENARSIDLNGKTIEIPVDYGGEYATDLPALCNLSGLSDREVVRIHHEAAYRVFALGSAPGFGYLHGLDPRIYMPRKTVPSLKMPKGCVTIGGMQTGVAMLTGPNGWNSIGFAALEMFDPASSRPAMMAPGDTVRFLPARIEL
ncbi:5-oxoprolinase subunit PxpB [Rhizobium ruizarguesonis]|uniref:5-oxoprolinase subunit PxpB n=1 Tax=Rhizobium ruizarguesonis TaxID=2081791 RepID=A0AB38HSV1_9HYPH|nr:5-oxoprolinase subunit PxpB [Rhizobium ruizarguesonis]TBA13316.1 5-oxoprolinase subunit PxpB [Rhizobium ruizarguesonis]TBA31858.1 5-oxoprolinase subunit PxpB [Rhizobium ruizarguesonis]TBA52788.1 5-oxoprolinase subunit PxpB [Rhizobium ruizarguesonis]TBB41478.1 5-oxoprolinase subunit PxpB [Rhizobium ruizarguesonis]TBB57366.1 5-oxoprolinase subunit PxpB [Rhizobium ruizarguesonis]